jgi:4-amino-4-deoxy-L-arabinose transferase-like glycosyltransferase
MKSEKSMNKIVLWGFICIAVLYFLPTLVQVSFDDELSIEEFYIGFPGVLSGDEPHYFVTTTSIINDHDLYIGNNYDNAYFNGGCDVGYRFANHTDPMMRHVRLFNPEEKAISIKNPYNREEGTTYEEDVAEFLETEEVSSYYEIPQRPLGLPVLSAIVLWPLADTCMVEYGAIYVTLLFSIIGIIFFYFIALHYVKKWNKTSVESKTLAMLFTLLFALSTQYWHYSKTYVAEPYLTVFLIVSYYLFFIKEHNILPGFLLAAGFSMKYPFAMYLVFFAGFLLLRRKWKRLSLFIMGSIPIIVSILMYNVYVTGSIFLARSEYLNIFDNVLLGMLRTIIDPTFGILPFAPFLIFAIPGAYILYKKERALFFILSVLIVPYFFFWSGFALTPVGAGGGYSSRYTLPIIPFLVLLSGIWFIQLGRRKQKIVFILLALIACIINMQAAFLYPLFWNNPVWILFEKIITKWDRIIEILL